MHTVAILAITAMMLTAAPKKPKQDYREALNETAEQYVRLMLDIGQHDPDFVDAYYGPKEWQESAKKMHYRLTALQDRADAVIARVKRIRVPKKDELYTLRKTYQWKQLIAAQTKIQMLNGTSYTFDEEAKRLYDVVPPKHTEAHFKKALAELEKALPPGAGSLQKRYQEFRDRFVIPREKLDTVFTSAILECRSRTKKYISLPEHESFTVEYVTDKSWSGYNWYQGNAKSLIQVNTDLPIFIDRAVDLAAHEGYPGHHVYNVLLESELLQKRGWIEFSIYPLFSPQSLVAEGSANYGINIVLPKPERLAFEKTILFPLAGLDPASAEQYYAVQELFGTLAYAGNEAARGYLNGTMTKPTAIRWLTQYALFDSARAEQRLRFIEKYRSYVINYNYGQDLVKGYVERKSGKKPTEKKRWSVFEELISSPRLPGALKGK